MEEPKFTNNIPEFRYMRRFLFDARSLKNTYTALCDIIQNTQDDDTQNSPDDFIQYVLGLIS